MRSLWPFSRPRRPTLAIHCTAGTQGPAEARKRGTPTPNPCFPRPRSQRRPKSKAPGTATVLGGRGTASAGVPAPCSPQQVRAAPGCVRPPQARSAALCPAAPARSRSPAPGSPVFRPRGSPLCWLCTVTQSTEARSSRSAAPLPPPPPPRISPVPLPALPGKAATTLARWHCASVSFLDRPSPGAQAPRTHPHRPSCAPPRPAPPLSLPGPSPRRRPPWPGSFHSEGLSSRGSPALPRSLLGVPPLRGALPSPSPALGCLAQVAL